MNTAMERSQARSSSAKAEARRARIRNSQPAAYLRTMLDIASERGLEPARALEGTNLSLALLDTPDFRVGARESAAVMMRVVQLTGMRGLGLEFGLRTIPTAHGFVGYAAMSCGRLREALELVIRYLHLRLRDVTLTLTTQDGYAILEATDTHDLGLFRQLVHEGLMVGFVRMFGFLLGDAKPECELWFDWPEPDYFAPFRARLPPSRFAMPAIQVRVPAATLERRLVLADPIAVRKAVEQCEHEMATTSPSPDTLLARVRAKLVLGSEGYPDLESVASCLFMSGRTLKRKLKERGTGFQDLLDEVRHADALRLLANPDLDIQRIATTLGYQDPPSFTRAFRRWSGQSPSEAREGRHATRSDRNNLE